MCSDIEPDGAGEANAGLSGGGGLVAHSPSDDGRWHLLADHLTSTGEAAAAFASAFDSAEAGRVVGLLHDLGKAAPAWQDYLRAAAAGERRPMVDHKHAGAFVLGNLGS